jgi:acyl-CoA synthetase (AMP-forming)/AMP-acid ligase II
VEEPGLLLGRIDTPQPLARFDGYDEAEATEAKILRDVFEPGDAWFNSGDLLRRDEDGDFWFVDRVGDTFRWKGENVSTTQVASVLAEAPFVALAAVYGINLPEREGRAGMAALELKDGAAFDGKALFELASAHLPPAARPRFVRIVEKLDVTGSLKLQKQALQAEGADPEQVEGEMYWYDERKTQYSLLDMRSFLSLILNS